MYWCGSILRIEREQVLNARRLPVAADGLRVFSKNTCVSNTSACRWSNPRPLPAAESRDSGALCEAADMSRQGINTHGSLGPSTFEEYVVHVRSPDTRPTRPPAPCCPTNLPANQPPKPAAHLVPPPPGSPREAAVPPTGPGSTEGPEGSGEKHARVFSRCGTCISAGQTMMCSSRPWGRLKMEVGAGTYRASHECGLCGIRVGQCSFNHYQLPCI